MANVVEIVIKGIDQTGNPFAGSLKNITTLQAGLTALVATASAAVVAFASVGKQFVNTADALGKLSEKTGVSVETLSRLKFVAEENDTTLEALSKAFRHAADEASKAGQTFEEFLFSQADEFAKYADGPGKAAEAVRLFGKEGAALIPILNQGSEGLRRALEEAGEFTTIIDGSTAAASDALNDELGRMSELLKKGITDVVKDLIPYMLELARAVTGMLKEAQEFGAFWSVIGEVLKAVAIAATGTITAFVGLGRALGQLLAAGIDAAAGRFDVARESLKLLASDAAKTMAEIQRIFSGQVNTPAPANSNKPQMELIDPEHVQKALGLNEKWQAERASGEQRIREMERLAYEARLDEIRKMSIAEADKDELRLLAEQAYQDKLTDLHNTGELARAQLDEAYRRGDIEAYQRNLQIIQESDIADLEAKKELLKTWHDLYIEAHRSAFSYAAEGARTISSGLSNAIVDVVMKTKSAAEAFKDLGLSIAKMFAQWIINRAVAFLAEKVLAAVGLGLAKAQAVAVTGIAAGIAAAWAPAATASLIATYGSSASAASLLTPAMLANQAAASSLTLAGGVAHGGLDFVPQDSTFLLSQGERIVQPRQNERLENMLDDHESGRAGGAPTVVEVNLDGERLFRALGYASRDGRLVLSARAVT